MFNTFYIFLSNCWKTKGKFRKESVELRWFINGSSIIWSKCWYLKLSFHNCILFYSNAWDSSKAMFADNIGKIASFGHLLELKRMPNNEILNWKFACARILINGELLKIVLFGFSLDMKGLMIFLIFVYLSPMSQQDVMHLVSRLKLIQF